MKLLELFPALQKIFDWYFNMDNLKRIQMNYIIVLILLITYIYYSHQTYVANITILSTRIDTINNSRTQEQEKYTAKLEYYTDKFNNLLVILIEQRKELKEIKEDK